MHRIHRKEYGGWVVCLASFVAPVLLVGWHTSHASQEVERFNDSVSGFTITKPKGWSLEQGLLLIQQAQKEAERWQDPRLGPQEGSLTTPLMRFTRYPTDRTRKPNPTITVIRFDLRQFPPDISVDDLLQQEWPLAEIEEGPRSVELGGRSWRTIRGIARLTRRSGEIAEAVTEPYVIKGEGWAIGLTITAIRRQYLKYRPVFDETLKSIRFQ